MLRRVCIAAALALALAGCATPYQEYRWYSGGYGETQLSETQYRVFFRDIARASPLRVRAFWLYRCAELTVAKGFDLMHLSGDVVRADAAKGDRATIAVWHPSERRALLRVGAFFPPYLLMLPPNALPPTNYSGTVTMFRRPLAEDLAFAVDARRVIELLTPYVESNGKIPEPGFEAVALDALVAHETLTLTVAFPERPPADATAAPRDSAELRARLEALDVRLKLHAAYHARTPSEGPAERGDVQLALRVAPGGRVSACIVASTSLSNSDLVEAVRQLVSEIQFDERRDAAPTDVAFAVAFTPEAPELEL